MRNETGRASFGQARAEGVVGEGCEDTGALFGRRRKANVDGRRTARFVFDLGFGQRRLVVEAPERGAQTFVDLLTLGQIGQRIDDRRFERGIDRTVGTIEEAEVSHANALIALAIQPINGALAATRAQLEGIDGMKIFDAQVLERFVLDREPVHVPAGNELGVLTVEQGNLHEHVLEDHVQEVTHVQIAVGVGRSVVQDPRPIGSVTGEAPLVRSVLAPPFDAAGLAQRKLGLHGKGRARKVERFAVIHAGYKSCPRTSKLRSAAARTASARSLRCADSASRWTMRRSTLASIASSDGAGSPGTQSGGSG